jgi:hypothetical protein
MRFECLARTRVKSPAKAKLAESPRRIAACARVFAVAALAMGDSDEAKGAAGDIRFRRELDRVGSRSDTIILRQHHVTSRQTLWGHAHAISGGNEELS